MEVPVGATAAPDKITKTESSYKPWKQQHGKSLQKTIHRLSLILAALLALIGFSPVIQADAQVTDQSLQQAADKLENALSKAMKNAGRSGNPSLPELVAAESVLAAHSTPAAAEELVEVPVGAAVAAAAAEGGGDLSLSDRRVRSVDGPDAA